MRPICRFLLSSTAIATALCCGMANMAQATVLPKVLLIGDSISRGYYEPTQNLLAGKFSVYQPIPGSGETNRALVYIDDWIAQQHWDVIHFNWGLHDVYTQNVDHPGVNAVPLEQYTQNLQVLVPKLVASGAKLVWCNTTPSYDAAPAFVESDITAYNAAAKTIMDQYQIPINNLHDLALPLLPGIQSFPGDIHYSNAGSQLFGAQVASSIVSAYGWQAPPRFGVALSHQGATDPFEEGWLVNKGATSPGIGTAVLNDQGKDAWGIADTSVSDGVYNVRGESSLTTTQYADIATSGWKLRATLRVDDSKGPYDATSGLAPGIQIALKDPGLWVLLGLGSDGNGNTTLNLRSGFESTSGNFLNTFDYTIAGNGYNDYELTWNSTDGLGLLVNGQQIVDNYDCGTDASWAGILGNRIYWGAIDGPGVGAGYWNNVEFEISAPVPEPGIVTLMLSAGAVCMMYGRRVRQSI